MALINFLELRPVLEQAGKIVRKFSGDYYTPQQKNDQSLITPADLESNRFLKQALTHLFPEAGWFSEESADDRERLRSEWLWIVDPLDGTREYVRGIPECAISIGLVHFGVVVLGGVLNPLTGEGAVGSVDGHIVFWGLEPLLRSVPSLGQALAAVSRTEIADGTAAPYVSMVGSVVPLGSVAYKMLRVVAGQVDMTFSVQPKSEWDICGGIALLKAVGKIYERFDGKPLRFNNPTARVTSGAVAASVPLVAAFLEKIGSYPRQ